jgi:small ligand-binding sensory domain FIST
MRWLSSISDLPQTELAVSNAVASLDERLAGAAPDLLLVFVSEDHRLAYTAIGEQIRKKWPKSLLAGCSAYSVIGAGQEIEGRPGLSLTAAILPDVTLRAFHLPPEETSLPIGGSQHWRDRLDISEAERLSFILLADPYTCDTETVLRGLDASFPRSATIGGLASGGDQPGQNALYLGETVHRSGLVGVALSGRIEVDTIIAQGCRPVGTPLFVTGCRENVIYELDGRPPLEIINELYEHVSSEDQELFRGSLFLGLEMREGQGEYYQGDFLIRNLIGVDEETGALAVAAGLRQAQVVQFHLRDARTSAADLEAHLARYESAATPPRSPEGALLFSCLGRGANLYGRCGHESEVFCRHLGNIPLAGFFCNGEIGPVQEQTFLHGYTSAFGLFREPGSSRF